MATVWIRNEPGATLSDTTTLVTESCINCGILFAFPTWYKDRRLKDHGEFRCPNGHSMIYSGKSEADKLREKLKAKERELEGANNSKKYYEGKFNDTQNILRATKGVVTRKKKELARVKNGVCPCCNRSFSNLHSHMQTKHPEFKP